MFYRLTAEGRSLWSRRDVLELPPDYRRILGLVESAGHHEAIAPYLLAEFEALRLIEPDPEVSFADISLTRLGVYVNYERISRRAPLARSPAETVALIVEDDPDQLALAVMRLTLAGYPVKTADGVQALFRYLEQHLPDAIFLDVMLWDGNGFDALATLRQDPKHADLPVIMVTSQAEPEDVAHGLALGCDGYVTKPYGANTLEYVLRYVMKQEIPLNGSAHRREEVVCWGSESPAP